MILALIGALQCLLGYLDAYCTLLGHYNACQDLLDRYHATEKYQVPLMLHDATPSIGMSFAYAARLDMLIENRSTGLSLYKGPLDIHPFGHY